MRICITDIHPGNEYYVANEYSLDSGKNKFDIFVAWDKKGKPYNKQKRFKNALVCEFKLESAIGNKQLLNYQKVTDQFVDNPSYAFISCQYYESDIEKLTRTEKWSKRLWWKFLRDWEFHMTNEIDDDSFRQFRATLWKQLT